MITQDRLKDLIHYNPLTGVFTWKQKRNNRIGAGMVAGTDGGSPYTRIFIDRIGYSAHRLAFLYMTGSIPHICDHKDRDRRNNRWGNLRVASPKQNQWNMGKSKRNTSGYKSVYWSKQKNKWHSQIMVGGKRKHVAFSDCKHHAFCEYVVASRKYFGEFSAV